MTAVVLENEDQEHLGDDLVAQTTLLVGREEPGLQLLEWLGPT